MSLPVVLTIGGILLLGLLFAWLKARELSRGESQKTPSNSNTPPPVTTVSQGATPPALTVAKAGFKKHEPHSAKKESNEKTEQLKPLPSAPSSPETKDPPVRRVPRKAPIELFEYGIKVAAAFVALSTTFALNAWKTEHDRKERLIAVLTRFHTNEIVYRQHLVLIEQGAFMMGNTRDYAFEKSIQDLQYPFFSDIKDQSIWDMSALSIPVFDNADYQVKFTLRDSLIRKDIHHQISTLNLYLNSSIKQIELEIKFQRDNDSSSMQDESQKNYSTQTLAPHRL
jgi:hypothetical protein